MRVVIFRIFQDAQMILLLICLNDYVHGIATAAGCQLVASCDLAVADESALA